MFQLPRDSNGFVAQNAYRPKAGAGQRLTLTNASQSYPSAAFSEGTGLIRVASNTTIYVEIGVAPVAVPESFLLGSNTPTVFVVKPGEKIACYSSTAAAVVQISELE